MGVEKNPEEPAPTQQEHEEDDDAVQDIIAGRLQNNLPPKPTTRTSSSTASRLPGAFSVRGMASFSSRALEVDNLADPACKSGSSELLVPVEVVGDHDLEAEYEERLLSKAVTAMPVTCNETAGVEQQLAGHNKKRPCKMWMIVVAFLLVLSSAIVGTTVYFITADRNEPMPVSDEEYLTQLFAQVSNLELLTLAQSPQNDALNWMLLDTSGTDLQSQSPIFLTERYVMAVLYFATQGDNWIHEFNFLSDNPVCQWNALIPSNNATEGGPSRRQGVICDQSSHILELRLGRNNLNGTFPSEVTALERVEILILRDNSLTGAIPDKLALMPGLAEIDFRRNFLSGTIPNTFSELNVNSVIFKDNQLTGTLPGFIVGNTKSLKIVDFGNNLLHGPIPPFDTYSVIERVWLENNAFTGTLPASLYAAQSLQTLSLSNNKLTGNLRQNVEVLDDLRLLHLDGNMFSGSIPTEIGKSKSLQSLQLQINRFESSIPATLGRLNKVETLNMANNTLTGELPPALGRLESLQVLDISDNPGIVGPVPSTFADFPSLVSFNLVNTGIDSGLNETICRANDGLTIQVSCDDTSTIISCNCCICY